MKLKISIILAAFLAASGCAASRSGDILISRPDLREMLSERAATPFSDLKVSWENFPYKNPTDYIGEGSLSGPPKPMSVPVPPEDLTSFKERARNIFAEAGLYDVNRGSGTLRLTLTSAGRWTYSELFRTFLVETAFVFIIPSSLRVNYYLTAEFETTAGPAKVEETGQQKTVFHLLLAPLYPFCAPGAKESSLIKNMLWKAALDVYARMDKRTRPAAAAGN